MIKIEDIPYEEEFKKLCPNFIEGDKYSDNVETFKNNRMEVIVMTVPEIEEDKPIIYRAYKTRYVYKKKDTDLDIICIRGFSFYFEEVLNGFINIFNRYVGIFDTEKEAMDKFNEYFATDSITKPLHKFFLSEEPFSCC